MCVNHACSQAPIPTARLCVGLGWHNLVLYAWLVALNSFHSYLRSILEWSFPQVFAPPLQYTLILSSSFIVFVNDQLLPPVKCSRFCVLCIQGFPSWKIKTFLGFGPGESLNVTEVICSDFKGKAGLLLLVHIQCWLWTNCLQVCFLT